VDSELAGQWLTPNYETPHAADMTGTVVLTQRDQVWPVRGAEPRGRPGQGQRAAASVRGA